MDSDQLFHLRQLFYQGSYDSCISTGTPLLASSPSSSSSSLAATTPEQVSLTVYVARAHLALSPPQTDRAIEILAGLVDDHVEAKAITHLAEYLSSPSPTSPSLDSLRDILIELEEEDQHPSLSEEGPAIAKGAAATAFFLAGELEEAVDVLAQENRNLECVALLVQIYLTMNRLDLAKRAYEGAKTWGEDSLLVQLMEAWIAMRTQGPSLQQAYYVYDELLSLPHGRTPTLLASHAAAHFLLAHYDEAKGDVENLRTLLLEQQGGAVGGPAWQGVSKAVLGVKGGEGMTVGRREEEEVLERRFEAAAKKFVVEV